MKIIKGERWDGKRAQTEFDIDADTLSKRVKANGIMAGEDGKFSTMQICAAIYGDLESERTRLTKEQANIASLKKDEMLRRLIPAELVERVWMSVLSDLRTKITNTELPDRVKKEILTDLQNLPIEEYFTDDSQTNQEKEEE